MIAQLGSFSIDPSLKNIIKLSIGMFVSVDKDDGFSSKSGTDQYVALQ